MGIVVYNEGKRHKPMYGEDTKPAECQRKPRNWLRFLGVVACLVAISAITYWQYRRGMFSGPAEQPHQHTFGKWGAVQENWYKPYQLRICTECGLAQKKEVSE